VLIGGAGASTLSAGGGGDILIAGRTAHDANVAALLAVLAEWGRTDRDYSARVSNLLGNGNDGLNGTVRLTPQTVTVAAGTDQLFGGAGRDRLWIAASPGATDQVNNFGLGDVLTFE
jgi:Ca2+-binding RTX toxin-like protein